MGVFATAPLRLSCVCACVMLAGAQRALAQEHEPPTIPTPVEIVLGADDETLTLELPVGWGPVSIEVFAQLSALDAGQAQGSSGLVAAYRPVTSDRAVFSITNLPNGRIDESELASLRGSDDEALLEQANRSAAQVEGVAFGKLHFDAARNLFRADADARPSSGFSSITAVLLTEQGTVLLQGMAEDIVRYGPVFTRLIESTRLSDSLRYKRGPRASSPASGTSLESAPLPLAALPAIPSIPSLEMRASLWGTLLGVFAAILLWSVWSRFGSGSPAGSSTARRSIAVLVVALMLLLLPGSLPQSLDAARAFGVTIALLALLRGVHRATRRA